MSFTLDNRNTSTLTADSRSANASFTADSRESSYAITWALEQLAWSAETRTWGQLISAFTADTRH